MDSDSWLLCGSVQLTFKCQAHWLIVSSVPPGIIGKVTYESGNKTSGGLLENSQSISKWGLEQGKKTEIKREIHKQLHRDKGAPRERETSVGGDAKGF